MALTAIPAAGAKLRGSIYSANVLEGRELYVSKGADESVTSSAVLQNDDALVLAVIANAVYHGELIVFYTGGNNAGDIQIAYTFPTGATLHMGAQGVHNSLLSGSTGDGEWVVRLSCVSGVTNIPFGASTSTLMAKVVVNLTTGGNAGNFQMQWAQMASNATATTIKAGSYMWLRRPS